MTLHHGHQPPPPLGPESGRVAHTRLRRRILYGEWEDDLLRRMEKLIGSVRREAWGKPDMSANVLRSITVQFATLYDRPPEIANPCSRTTPSSATASRPCSTRPRCGR